MQDRRVRPTALLPIWNIVGYAVGKRSCIRFSFHIMLDNRSVQHLDIIMLLLLLISGAGSAMLGKEPAMALTVAVEEVISTNLVWLIFPIDWIMVYLFSLLILSFLLLIYVFYSDIYLQVNTITPNCET